MRITSRKTTFSLRFAVFTEGLDPLKSLGTSLLTCVPGEPRSESTMLGAHHIPIVSPPPLCHFSSLAASACGQQIGFCGHAHK